MSVSPKPEHTNFVPSQRSLTKLEKRRSFSLGSLWKKADDEVFSAPGLTKDLNEGSVFTPDVSRKSMTMRTNNQIDLRPGDGLKYFSPSSWPVNDPLQDKKFQASADRKHLSVNRNNNIEVFRRSPSTARKKPSLFNRLIPRFGSGRIKNRELGIENPSTSESDDVSTDSGKPVKSDFKREEKHISSGFFTRSSARRSWKKIDGVKPMDLMKRDSKVGATVGTDVTPTDQEERVDNKSFSSRALKHSGSESLLSDMILLRDKRKPQIHPSSKAVPVISNSRDKSHQAEEEKTPAPSQRLPTLQIPTKVAHCSSKTIDFKNRLLNMPSYPEPLNPNDTSPDTLPQNFTSQTPPVLKQKASSKTLNASTGLPLPPPPTPPPMSHSDEDQLYKHESCSKSSRNSRNMKPSSPPRLQVHTVPSYRDATQLSPLRSKSREFFPINTPDRAASVESFRMACSSTEEMLKLWIQDKISTTEATWKLLELSDLSLDLVPTLSMKKRFMFREKAEMVQSLSRNGAKFDKLEDRDKKSHYRQTFSEEIWYLIKEMLALL